MSNPFKPHALSVFSDRDNVDAALAYAMEVINTFDGANKAAAWTALMVVVNTAAKLWPEAPAPVADDTDQVRAADASVPATGAWVEAQTYQRVCHQLEMRIVDLDARLAVLEAAPSATPEDMAKAVESWADDNIDRHIENWADTYLDDRMESWASDNLDLDDRVETWMENNLDIENEVRKTLRNASLSVEF
jgi:hypothetical protein